MSGLRNLLVGRQAVELVEQVYRATEHVPGREREYRHPLPMPQSLAEVETQTEIAFRLSYLRSDSRQALLRRILSLRNHLYALRNSVTKQ